MPPPNPPVSISVALPVEEARALFDAASTVLGSLSLSDNIAADGGRLVRATTRLAEAIDACAAA